MQEAGSGRIFLLQIDIVLQSLQSLQEIKAVCQIITLIIIVEAPSILK